MEAPDQIEFRCDIVGEADRVAADLVRAVVRNVRLKNSRDRWRATAFLFMGLFVVVAGALVAIALAVSS